MGGFLDEIKKRVLVFDGSKGYMLQKLGLTRDECSEIWNVTHREDVKRVYTAYRDAGSDIIQTNTFPGNRIHLEKYSLGDRTYELNFEAAKLAREVMGEDGLVAASIGPTGMLFEPSGELTFNAAYEIFKEQVEAVVDGGVNIINFETFTDLAEMRAALIAAKEVCSLPVICSMSFEANGRTLMGNPPHIVVTVLKSLGADMVGTNCSFGAGQLLDIIRKMAEAGGGYLCAKPNAGLPEVVDGRTCYRESPEKFASLAGSFVESGVRLIGGCCGTTPEFISAVKKKIQGLPVPEVSFEASDVITSGVKLSDIKNAGRINTGLLDAGRDAEFAKALSCDDMDCVLDMSMDLAAGGFDAVYINVDGAGGDAGLLERVVGTAQSYIRQPLIIETGSLEALERALRIYNGRAGVTAGKGSGAECARRLEIIRKYGAVAVPEEILDF